MHFRRTLVLLFIFEIDHRLVISWNDYIGVCEVVQLHKRKKRVSIHVNVLYMNGNFFFSVNVIKSGAVSG